MQILGIKAFVETTVDQDIRNGILNLIMVQQSSCMLHRLYNFINSLASMPSRDVTSYDFLTRPCTQTAILTLNIILTPHRNLTLTITLTLTRNTEFSVKNQNIEHWSRDLVKIRFLPITLLDFIFTLRHVSRGVIRNRQRKIRRMLHQFYRIRHIRRISECLYLCNF